ncbi:polysaccharide deacetylase family protein [Candidatus Bathyarchaeota archaeon]|nr:polysaccharide deacetylase family protein [Candidatus Bathyarchaeota archaeon]
MNAILIRTIKTFYRFACIFCCLTGLCFLLSYLKRNEPVILTYHSINDKCSPNIYPDSIVSIRNFEEHLKFLSQKRNVIGLEELVRCLEKREKLSPHTVVITFDDGYYDFFLNAHPVLNKYGAPSTVFLMTRYLDSGEGKWDDKLAFLINTADSSSVQLTIGGKDRVFRTSTKEEKAFSIRELQSRLCGLDEEELLETVNKIEETIGLRQSTLPITTMRRREIALLKADPLVSFGAHTHDHRDLGKTSDELTESEIRTSKEEIEKMTGKKCLFFSYPFGKKKNLNSRVKSILRAEGFSGAVTAIPGTIRLDSDLFELKRIVVTDNTMPEFKCALVGFTLQRP